MAQAVFVLPCNRRGVAGFTLIELLCVIAIIVVLVAVLIPSLSNARERARMTVCASNMRQVYVATENYATENMDKYPDAKTTLGNWSVRIAPGMVSKNADGSAMSGALPEVYGLAAVLDGLNKPGGDGVTERIGPSYLSGKSKVWICDAYAPEFKVYGNTYAVNTATAIAEYKMDRRQVFTNNDSSLYWITCTLYYSWGVSGNMYKSSWLSDKTLKITGGRSYPHRINTFRCANKLYMSGAVLQEKAS